MTQKTFKDLRIGDTLRNNDPRKNGETITITDIIRRGLPEDSRACYQAGTRTAKIAGHRIFFDGKDRHQGYNYVEPVEYAPVEAGGNSVSGE